MLHTTRSLPAAFVSRQQAASQAVQQRVPKQLVLSDTAPHLGARHGVGTRHSSQVGSAGVAGGLERLPSGFGAAGLRALLAARPIPTVASPFLKPFRRSGRPGCTPWGGAERRRAAACAAVGSPRRPALGQLHAQHPLSRLSTQQQQQKQPQQQQQQTEQQQQLDAEPKLGAAHQQAQRQPQDGQPQRPDWQLRRVDTLPALLQLAMPQPKRGEVQETLPQEGDPQQQQAAAAGGEQPADEYRGPKLRYGRQVSSRAELEAAVLAHWSATAGDRIPGTDKHESLALPGLAGERPGMQGVLEGRGSLAGSARSYATHACAAQPLPHCIFVGHCARCTMTRRSDSPLPIPTRLADIAVVSRAGREYDDWKLSNQDCHLLLPLPSTCTLATAASSDEEDPVAAEQQPHAVVLGVFDGHGLMGTAARWGAVGCSHDCVASVAHNGSPDFATCRTHMASLQIPRLRCLPTCAPFFHPRARSRYTRQFIATGLLRSQWRHVEGPCEGFGSSGSQDGDMGSLGGSLGAPAEGSAEAAQQLLEAAFECAGMGILNSGLELRESGSTAVVCHVEPGRWGEGWGGGAAALCWPTAVLLRLPS